MTLPDWYAAGAVKTFLILAGPGLGVCLVLGVAGAILQTTTQVREAALGFVPKIIGLAFLFLFAGGVTIKAAGEYASHVFRSIPEIVHVRNNQ